MRVFTSRLRGISSQEATMEARADTRNNKAAVINSSSGETLWHGTSRERRDRSVCVEWKEIRYSREQKGEEGSSASM